MLAGPCSLQRLWGRVCSLTFLVFLGTPRLVIAPLLSVPILTLPSPLSSMSDPLPFHIRTLPIRFRAHTDNLGWYHLNILTLLHLQEPFPKQGHSHRLSIRHGHVILRTTIQSPIARLPDFPLSQASRNESEGWIRQSDCCGVFRILCKIWEEHKMRTGESRR